MRFQVGALVVVCMSLFASIAVAPGSSQWTEEDSHQREHMLQHQYGEPHESHQHEIPTTAQYHAVTFDGLSTAIPPAANAIGRVTAAHEKLAGLTITPLVAPPRAPVV